MDLSRVVFVGGDARLGSVQIRCVQIACALHCRHFTDITARAQLPDDIDAVVLVKPLVPLHELRHLATFWDIIDAAPPRGARTHLASTQHALDAFGLRGFVIPHHHANDDVFNVDSSKTGWIGGAEWCPDYLDDDISCVFTNHATLDQVRNAYRRIGIALNLRQEHPHLDAHLAANAGIKLINAIGFGIPSISSDEPAYRELAPECTLFTTALSWRRDLERLQHDGELRAVMRNACRRRAREFSLAAIAERYRQMLATALTSW